ncbi:hypothetical protein DV735_g443, partial [Chaetothyriales sp. CBS 134920]
MSQSPLLRVLSTPLYRSLSTPIYQALSTPVCRRAVWRRQLLHKRLFHGRDRFFRVSEEVEHALETGKPVVALETTIYTHGYPYPQNLALSSRLESLVRVNGGVPATIGIVDGVARVGLTVDELIRLVKSTGSKDTWKVSRRDLAFIGGLSTTGRNLHGGTTVAATMLLAHWAGIKIFATGGLGGVHRGAESSMDISADLTELGRTPVAVVSSGCKSFLDIGRTLEYLETQGVGVATFADGREESELDFPAFWARDSGVKSPLVIKDEAEAAAVVYAQATLGLNSGLLLANPVPADKEIPRREIESVIASAVEEAKWNAIDGNAYTPYVLKRIRELTEGRSMLANTALVEANVIRGTKVAVELAKLEQQGGTVDERKSQAAGRTVLVKQQHTPEPISQVDVLVAGSLASDTICDYTPVPASATATGPVLETSNPASIATGPVLETSNPASISQSAGGVGRNVAMAAHLAGSKVALTSAVANDIAGLSLLDQLQRSGLSTSMIRRFDTESGVRTAQYVAVNDGKKDLVVAMADMSILAAAELESQDYWENHLEASRPKWLVVDANWSPAIMSTIVKAARAKNISVAFEAVSTAKAIRLFDKRKPTIRPSDIVPKHSVNLVTPNALELNAMHTAARDAGYFESADWWRLIDALGLSSSGSQEKLNSIAQPELVQQGIPQQCIQLLPLVPNIVTKLGAKGVLLTQLLRPNDAKLRDPDFAQNLLARQLDDNAAVGGVYMRLFPATNVAEDEIVSVNGAGDTILGVIVAGLVNGRDLDQVMHVAQEAAVLTLKSKEAVSPELTLLYGQSRTLTLRLTVLLRTVEDMLLAVASLLLWLNTGFTAAATGAEAADEEAASHYGLINEWTDNLVHTLVPRNPDWNSTWIDSERNLCADPLASAQCCPGYCSVNYQNLTGGLFYTCCPLGYYAAAFGKSNQSTNLEILCCDETVSPCKKGKSTEQAVVPFVNATSDVQTLEQQCSTSTSTSNGASKEYILSTSILLTIAGLVQLSVLG